MGDPEFVKALQADKVACVGNYWGSEEFARLNRAVGGVLCSWQHGVLEIGFDFAEPYNFAKHSTGMMFMRWVSALQFPCLEGCQLNHVCRCGTHDMLQFLGVRL